MTAFVLTGCVGGMQTKAIKYTLYELIERIKMIKEVIHVAGGERITIHLSEEGYCHCPVCGKKATNKEWRPYDQQGFPSYDICACCGFEYGFDDAGEPPYKESWKEYRQRWLKGEVDGFINKNMSREAKFLQLRILGLEP